MDKSTEINTLLEKLSKNIFNNSREKAIKNRTCVKCKQKIKKFKDKISEREYRLSGLCQCCQDEYFGE